MLVAIVPVKPLQIAKTRLSDLLTISERRMLVLAMLDDVLAALGVARGIERIGVISADRTVLARAAALGADQLLDTVGDLNAALAQAAGYYAARGARTNLIVHADVPLVAPPVVPVAVAAPGSFRFAVLVVGRGGGNATPFDFARLINS